MCLKKSETKQLISWEFYYTYVCTYVWNSKNLLEYVFIYVVIQWRNMFGLYM